LLANEVVQHQQTYHVKVTVQVRRDQIWSEPFHDQHTHVRGRGAHIHVADMCVHGTGLHTHMCEFDPHI